MMINSGMNYWERRGMIDLLTILSKKWDIDYQTNQVINSTAMPNKTPKKACKGVCPRSSFNVPSDIGCPANSSSIK